MCVIGLLPYSSPAVSCSGSLKSAGANHRTHSKQETGYTLNMLPSCHRATQKQTTIDNYLCDHFSESLFN